ncbi:MAG: MmcQ/YjbR family DNA-binding protein [Pseudomonadota bacterium]
MTVTREEIDGICAALPGAVQALPPELLSWKVGGKMFACFAGGEAPIDGVSVKCKDTETAEILIDAGAAIRARYFHRSWVRLPFDTTGTDEARHRIEISYDLIRGSLKKADREALPPRESA